MGLAGSMENTMLALLSLLQTGIHLAVDYLIKEFIFLFRRGI